VETNQVSFTLVIIVTVSFAFTEREVGTVSIISSILDEGGAVVAKIITA